MKGKIILFLRCIYWKTLYFNFKYLPFKQAVKLPFHISSNILLRNVKGTVTLDCKNIFPGMIQIGYRRIGIFDNRRYKGIWEVSGNIVFRGLAIIGSGCKISIQKNALLDIGNNFTFVEGAAIIATNKILIGEHAFISWHTLIMDTDFHPIMNEKGEVINHSKPVIIGKRVWIGIRNTILNGAVIPDNSIIGACSVTAKQFTEPNSIYVGNPARCIKNNIDWSY